MEITSLRGFERLECSDESVDISCENPFRRVLSAINIMDSKAPMIKLARVNKFFSCINLLDVRFTLYRVKSKFTCYALVLEDSWFML